MLETYRKWLVGVWGIGFILPFILVLFQFGSGKYGNKSSEVLGWLTALTLPTILLMIGVLVANPANNNAEEEMINPTGADETEEEKEARAVAKNKAAHEKFIFKLALCASVIYLLIINFVFFLEPLADSKPQELMRDSKIFLAVFDSIISLLIGYFFGKK
jgi:uncharacterized protein YqhQ